MSKNDAAKAKVGDTVIWMGRRREVLAITNEPSSGPFPPYFVLEEFGPVTYKGVTAAK